MRNVSHTVRIPMQRGEVQHCFISPGLIGRWNTSAIVARFRIRPKTRGPAGRVRRIGRPPRSFRMRPCKSDCDQWAMQGKVSAVVALSGWRHANAYACLGIRKSRLFFFSPSRISFLEQFDLVVSLAHGEKRVFHVKRSGNGQV